MTNEEIEKRFLFDLEMGRFTTNLQSGFIVFETDYIPYIRIITILYKNGFKIKPYLEDFNPTENRWYLINGLKKIYGIDIKNKVCCTRCFDMPNYDYNHKERNEAPSYLID